MIALHDRWTIFVYDRWLISVPMLELPLYNHLSIPFYDGWTIACNDRFHDRSTIVFKFLFLRLLKYRFQRSLHRFQRSFIFIVARSFLTILFTITQRSFSKISCSHPWKIAVTTPFNDRWTIVYISLLVIIEQSLKIIPVAIVEINFYDGWTIVGLGWLNNPLMLSLNDPFYDRLTVPFYDRS